MRNDNARNVSTPGSPLRSSKGRSPVVYHSYRRFCRIGLMGTQIVVMLTGSLFAADKLVDKILLPHDPSPQGIYRWSGMALLNLDEKQHLLLLATAYGQGGHDHTESRILEFHSRDGGLTWTPLAEAKVFQENIGQQNVSSPSLLRLHNGDILFFFTVKNPPTLTDSGAWMRRSTDNGLSWSKPQRLPYENYGGVAQDRAMQHSSGRLILPCWVSKDRLGSTHAYTFYSDDNGHIWKKSPLITTPAGSTGRKTDPAAEEPTVIELKDGRLMMFLRCYLKSIYVSYSSDRGESWSEPTSSGIPSPGSMATIKRLPDGKVLLIWNFAPVEYIDGPFPRTQLTAAVSTDDGKNFTHRRALDGDTDFSDRSKVPKTTMASVEFSGDRAIIVYSKSLSRKNAYNCRLQVVPFDWFVEGEAEPAYGESYLPILNGKLADK